MKTTYSPADKKRVETVITRIAEAHVRGKSPSLYPDEYTLAWCVNAVKWFRIKLTISVIVLFALTTLIEIGVWNAITTLIEIGVWNAITIHSEGWLCTSVLIFIAAFSLIPLLEKMLSPGSRVENLVFEVERQKHKFRQLGKAFMAKLSLISPDRTSMGGANLVTLWSDARLAVEAVLMEMIYKYLDIESRGAFGAKRLRKKLGTLHKRAVALEIGMDKEIKTYFAKVPKVVVIRDILPA